MGKRKKHTTKKHYYQKQVRETSGYNELYSNKSAKPRGADVVDNTGDKYTVFVPHYMNVLIKKLHTKYPTKEWSAIAKLTKDVANQRYVLSDIIFGEQNNNGAYTAMTEKGFKDIYDWIVDNDVMDAGNRNCRLHSHNKMSLFWSGTDDATKQSFNDNFINHFFHIVTNYTTVNGAIVPGYKSALTFYKPTNIEFSGSVVIEQPPVAPQEYIDNNDSYKKAVAELEIAIANSQNAVPDIVEGSDYIDNILMQTSYTQVQQDLLAQSLQAAIDTAQRKVEYVVACIKADYVDDTYQERIDDRIALLADCDLPPPLPTYQSYNNYGTDTLKGWEIYDKLINLGYTDASLYKTIKEKYQSLASTTFKDKPRLRFNDDDVTIEIGYSQVGYAMTSFFRLYVHEYTTFMNSYFTVTELFGAETLNKIKGTKKKNSYLQFNSFNEMTPYYFYNSGFTISGKPELETAETFIAHHIATLQENAKTSLNGAYRLRVNNGMYQMENIVMNTKSAELSALSLLQAYCHVLKPSTLIDKDFQDIMLKCLNNGEDEEPTVEEMMNDNDGSMTYEVDYQDDNEFLILGLVQELGITQAVLELDLFTKRINKINHMTYGIAEEITEMYAREGTVYVHIKDIDGAYTFKKLSEFLDDYALEFTDVFSLDLKNKATQGLEKVLYSI